MNQQKATDSKPDGRRTHGAADVARLTGIGRNKVYDLLRSGEIPSLRFGSKFFVPDTVLETWLNTCGGKVNNA